MSTTPVYCEMMAWCGEPVTYIGSGGYTYCTVHGLRRRASGYERTRKMTKTELRTVLTGGTIPSYNG